MLDSFRLCTECKSFKHSEKLTGWYLKELLSFMFNLFHESPSTHANYKMFTEAHNLDCLLQFWCYIWIESKKIQNEQEMSHHVTTVEGWGGLVNGRQGVSYSQTLHSKQFS